MAPESIHDRLFSDKSDVVWRNYNYTKIIFWNANNMKSVFLQVYSRLCLNNRLCNCHHTSISVCPCSGLLEWLCGRYSASVECPTLVWAQQRWWSSLRRDQDWANPVVHLVLRKCKQWLMDYTCISCMHWWMGVHCTLACTYEVIIWRAHNHSRHTGSVHFIIILTSLCQCPISVVSVLRSYLSQFHLRVTVNQRHYYHSNTVDTSWHNFNFIGAYVHSSIHTEFRKGKISLASSDTIEYF